MAVWGFRRGLLSGLIGTAKYAVGVPVSLFVSHQYYQVVYDKLVEPKALAKVQEKITGASGVDTFMAALQDKMQALPQALQRDFDFAALKKGSAKTAADFVMQQLVEPAACLLVKIALFLLSFIIIALICWLLSAMLRKKQGKNTIFTRTTAYWAVPLGWLRGVCFWCWSAAFGRTWPVTTGCRKITAYMRSLQTAPF